MSSVSGISRCSSVNVNGLVNVLTKEEILDMLAYIESAGKENSAFFRN